MSGFLFSWVEIQFNSLFRFSCFKYVSVTSFLSNARNFSNILVLKIIPGSISGNISDMNSVPFKIVLFLRISFFSFSTGKVLFIMEKKEQLNLLILEYNFP